jgi:trehalose 6-phosphate phosphatase
LFIWAAPERVVQGAICASLKDACSLQAMSLPNIPPIAADDNLALFLDVDGTLLEIAETPDAVVVPESLKSTLDRLSVRLCGALALISGRSVQTLDALFAPFRFAAAGVHGCERREPDGRIIVPVIDMATFAAAREQLAAWVRRHPGALLEDKNYALALHYRQAPSLETAAHDEAIAALRILGEAYELQRGKAVFEIRPAGYSKGSAISTFMTEVPFRDRRAVFIGDDITDEAGFAVVNQLGGISVRVGAVAASAARYRFNQVNDVAQWLAALASSP